jgi:hypothetical protein
MRKTDCKLLALSGDRFTVYNMRLPPLEWQDLARGLQDLGDAGAVHDLGIHDQVLGGQATLSQRLVVHKELGHPELCQGGKAISQGLHG